MGVPCVVCRGLGLVRGGDPRSGVGLSEEAYRGGAPHGTSLTRPDAVARRTRGRAGAAVAEEWRARERGAGHTFPMPVSLPKELTLELGLDEPDDGEALKTRVARRLGVPSEELPLPVVLGRSLDARRGRIHFRLRLGLDPEFVATLRRPGAPPREVKGERRVLIVGDGPAGLFCAYELGRAGCPAVVLERGKTVQPRRHDLVGVQRGGVVDPNSNYCFGEGGAGTFSDGKLYTRATKRGDVDDVLSTLVAHGAPESILSDGRPHIGSNRLPKVVTGLREHLAAVGIEFRFGARVAGLDVVASGTRRRIRGVLLADGTVVGGDAVVLATGHSARDVFEMLAALGLRLEAKPFALGVRMEHPQALINRIQYGSLWNHPRLPNADYRLSRTEAGRGVFSFCMCPGGFIVPAATEPDGVVVNGMSLSRRDSPFANSAMVVTISVADLEAGGFHGPLGGLELQRAVERRAFEVGGGAFRAPACRLTDFMATRPSTTLPACSYRPGVVAADLDDVLGVGRVPVAQALRGGLREFSRKMRGLLTAEAVLLGVESRTSSPVRIVRDPATCEHPELAGFYPVGEGAGYAGGIVSAALDGIHTARAVLSALGYR